MQLTLCSTFSVCDFLRVRPFLCATFSICDFVCVRLCLGATCACATLSVCDFVCVQLSLCATSSVCDFLCVRLSLCATFSVCDFLCVRLSLCATFYILDFFVCVRLSLFSFTTFSVCDFLFVRLPCVQHSHYVRYICVKMFLTFISFTYHPPLSPLSESFLSIPTFNTYWHPRRSSTVHLASSFRPVLSCVTPTRPVIVVPTYW